MSNIKAPTSINKPAAYPAQPSFAATFSRLHQIQAEQEVKQKIQKGDMNK